MNATPAEFLALMTGLRAAAVEVTVLTGTADPVANQDVFDAKAQYLTSLGLGQCWDSMTVIAATGDDLSNAKAKWCVDNSCDILIDNDKGNARAAVAAGVALVLVPWATRE